MKTSSFALRVMRRVSDDDEESVKNFFHYAECFSHFLMVEGVNLYQQYSHLFSSFFHFLVMNEMISKAPLDFRRLEKYSSYVIWAHFTIFLAFNAKPASEWRKPLMFRVLGVYRHSCLFVKSIRIPREFEELTFLWILFEK